MKFVCESSTLTRDRLGLAGFCFALCTLLKTEFVVSTSLLANNANTQNARSLTSSVMYAHVSDAGANFCRLDASIR